jgi:CII-binding regulator of phage lambda lysogenization HflD
MLTKEDIKALLKEERAHTKSLFEEERKHTAKILDQKFEGEREHTAKIIDQKLEPVKNQLDTQGKKIDNLTSEVSHLKTASEAIIAGLTELKKAVTSDKEVKIRLKNLEEHTGTTDPTIH